MKKMFILIAAMSYLAACNTKTDNAGTTAATTETKEANSEEAKEERNKQTALASIHALMKGNVDSTLANVTPDAVDYGDGSMAPVKNRDTVAKMMKIWVAAVPDYKAEDLVAVADGNKVMIYGVWTGTWKNELMGMKPTGKTIKMHDVDIFTFNDDGKIIEHRNIQTNNELARQLGMPMKEKK